MGVDKPYKFEINQITELGLCYYNSKIESSSNGKRQANKKKIKVICLTTMEIFNSINEAELKYHCSNIGSYCMGKHAYSGKLPDGTKLHWMHYNEYLQHT